TKLLSGAARASQEKGRRAMELAAPSHDSSRDQLLGGPLGSMITPASLLGPTPPLDPAVGGGGGVESSAASPINAASRTRKMRGASRTVVARSNDARSSGQA